ncbi:MAG: NUDIX domain-containing protein [Candidatus Sungbacteria bacterium]|nr:NUDIX domain-containing protein [Candidatus Sungbacteria bacterium]
MERPKVGIGVIVVRGRKILIGERLSGHGSGTFEIPGGHLEFGETFEEAAKREVAEETGLTNIEVKGVVSIGNDIAFDKHYVSIGILAESNFGEPYDVDATVAQNWQWYEPENIPEPFFPHSKRVVDNWLNGTIYTDKELGTSKTNA